MHNNHRYDKHQFTENQRRRSKYYHPLHNQTSSLMHSGHSHLWRNGNQLQRSAFIHDDFVTETEGIHFVSFWKYARVKDVSFYSKKITRHKIMCRSAYFPEEEEEERIAEDSQVSSECNIDERDTMIISLPTSSNEEHLSTQQCVSAAQHTTVSSMEPGYDSHISSYSMSSEVHRSDSFSSNNQVTSTHESPSTLADADNSSLLSDFRVQCRIDAERGNCVGRTLRSASSEVHDRDSVISVTDSFSSFSVSEPIIRNSHQGHPSFRKVIKTDVKSLTTIIRSKLLESSTNRFVIWLKDINVDVAASIALFPNKCIVCVKTVNFLTNREVMSIFQSIGMVFQALPMFDRTRNAFKLVWILSFDHQPFVVADSDKIIRSTRELDSIAANHFGLTRDHEHINTIRMFSERHNCNN